MDVNAASSPPVHPAELDTLAALNERVLRHLAEETFPEKPTPDEPALPH
jgi:ribosomal protein S6